MNNLKKPTKLSLIWIENEVYLVYECPTCQQIIKVAGMKGKYKEHDCEKAEVKTNPEILDDNPEKEPSHE